MAKFAPKAYQDDLRFFLDHFPSFEGVLGVFKKAKKEGKILEYLNDYSRYSGQQNGYLAAQIAKQMKKTRKHDVGDYSDKIRDPEGRLPEYFFLVVDPESELAGVSDVMRSFILFHELGHALLDKEFGITAYEEATRNRHENFADVFGLLMVRAKYGEKAFQSLLNDVKTLRVHGVAGKAADVFLYPDELIVHHTLLSVSVLEEWLRQNNNPALTPRQAAQLAAQISFQTALGKEYYEELYRGGLTDAFRGQVEDAPQAENLARQFQRHIPNYVPDAPTKEYVAARHTEVVMIEMAIKMVTKFFGTQAFDILRPLQQAQLDMMERLERAEENAHFGIASIAHKIGVRL